MKDRIKELRLALNLSQEALAGKLKLSQNYICLLEKGDRSPSKRTINDICALFSISEQWLRTGEGEMFMPRPRDQQIALFFSSVLKVNDDSSKGDKIKRDLISALAKLSPECWEKLADVAAELTKEE